MSLLTKIGLVVFPTALAVHFWDSIPSWLFPLAITFGIAYVILGLQKTSKSESKEDIKKHIGEDYDSAVKRCRVCRFVFFLFSLVVFLFGPGLIVNLLLSIVWDKPDFVFWLIMFAGYFVGVQYFSKYLPNYIVSVPQIQGFVTVNNVMALLGLPGVTDVPYGPGWHFSYPWENRSVKSNFSLEVITYETVEQVPGKNVRLDVTIAVQFEAAVSRGARYIGIDEATFNDGVMKVILARVSQELHDKGGDEAKGEIDHLNSELNKEFAVSEGDEPSNFEKKYAIRVVNITISGIDLPEETQKTRDAVDQASQVLIGVAAMNGYRDAADLITALENKEGKGITREQYNEMLDRFMTQNGKANMNINALKLAGLDVLAPLAKKLLGGEL